jgi:hypothetical protein
MENNVLEWLSVKGMDLRTFDRFGNGLTSRDVIHKRKEKPRQQFSGYKSKPKKNTKVREITHKEYSDKHGVLIEYKPDGGRYYSKSGYRILYTKSINGNDAMRDFLEFINQNKSETPTLVG